MRAPHAVCTHAKCIVNGNNTEKSWDCPCHGARFDTDGAVLTGPARENLKKVKVNSLKEK
ncbi:Rieske 2Fe-2S domain-containing protein [Dyadobacter sp. 32]|uniref:Rieske 2Fe-2S domain-containing protein n=1 Tax=Dyadobacter sp. 32 TaxID=538966 RepID=UPI0011EDACB7